MCFMYGKVHTVSSCSLKEELVFGGGALGLGVVASDVFGQVGLEVRRGVGCGGAIAVLGGALRPGVVAKGGVTPRLEVDIGFALLFGNEDRAFVRLVVAVVS